MQKARVIAYLAVLTLLPPLPATHAGEGGAGPAAGVPSAEPRQGTLHRRILLTGELVAARSTPVVVPRTPSWRVEIRWLIEDGAAVEAGDPVVELDNTVLAARLEELRLEVLEAESSLLTATLDVRVERAAKELEVERRRVALEKARLAVSTPPGLLSRVELESRRLAQSRAEAEHAKVREELAALRRGQEADLAIRRIELEKAERELAVVEASLEALTLRAPEAGIVLVGDHPWEERKLQVGDSVWVGFPVVTLPDPGSFEVRAALADVDDGKVEPGMTARCSLDAYPGSSHPCRVRAVAPIARRPHLESRRRSFQVSVDLEDAELRHTLLPGMSVRVEVETLSIPGVALVPRAAVDFSSAPARTVALGSIAPGLEVGPCNAIDCSLTGARVPAGAGPTVPAGPAAMRRDASRKEEAAIPPEEAPASPEEAPIPPEEAPVLLEEAPVPPPASRADIGERLEAWARAWSAGDVESYLAFYAASFSPPAGLDRAAWEAQRRARLTAPDWIDVAVEAVEIADPEPGRRDVRFLQRYASDRFQSIVWKRQTWVAEGGRWKILAETVEKDPPQTAPREQDG